MVNGDPVVIRTKLIPPVRDSGLVARDRLLLRLSSSLDRSVILVRAPAGYGKTTLAGQWLAALAPGTDLGAWYSLDAADNDPGRFFTYLVASLRMQVKDFGATVLGQLKAGVRLVSASLSGAFLNEIAMLDRRVNIVLDDFHLLNNTDIIDAMGLIIDKAPANLRLLVVSRETPQLPLGRLRALGRVVEITSDELRFRGLETGSFLSLAGHTGLSAAQLHALEKHTEGWAAGLQLASISLSNRDDVEEFIEAFSGNHREVADFLAEDVLQRQDKETREFLLQTSILERLCPSLCDEIRAADNGRRMLDILESRGLFLFSLDSEREWYRYHHLFSEFLRKHYHAENSDHVGQLHIRASEWFARQGCVDEAIQHAMAGKDMERAAGLLNEACDDLFYSGRLSTLSEWYKQIPEAYLRHYPRILLDQAWSIILEWKFALARRMLDDVGVILKEKAARNDSGSELVFLRSMLKHREMMYALFSDDMPPVERLSAEMLDDFPGADPYLRGNLYTCRIYAQREMFDFSNVNRFDALSLRLYEEANSRFVLIWHYSILGPTELERGKLDRAEESLVLARSIASEISGELSPLAAMPGILLGEVFYERHQLDEAERLLEQYLPLADRIGFVDQLIAGYICRARLLIAAGDDKESKRVLKKAEELGIKRGFERFGINIDAELARQAFITGDSKIARRMFQDLFRHTQADSLYPGYRATRCNATRALIWCRLARAEGLLDAASLVCSKWIRFARKRNAVRTEIQFNVLLAHILHESGESRASMRALRHALMAAIPGGFIRTIVDEMENSLILLSRFVQGQHTMDDPALTLATRLLEIIAVECGGKIPISSSCVDTALSDLPAEPISEREREILQLVAHGLLNREIADSLSLTEGSVKWHLQQIYDKVGIRRRALVVQRARDLGFIR